MCVCVFAYLQFHSFSCCCCCLHACTHTHTHSFCLNWNVVWFQSSSLFRYFFFGLSSCSRLLMLFYSPSLYGLNRFWPLAFWVTSTKMFYISLIELIPNFIISGLWDNKYLVGVFFFHSNRSQDWHIRNENGRRKKLQMNAIRSDLNTTV